MLDALLPLHYYTLQGVYSDCSEFMNIFIE